MALSAFAGEQVLLKFAPVLAVAEFLPSGLAMTSIVLLRAVGLLFLISGVIGSNVHEADYSVEMHDGTKKMIVVAVPCKKPGCTLLQTCASWAAVLGLVVACLVFVYGCFSRLRLKYLLWKYGFPRDVQPIFDSGWDPIPIRVGIDFSPVFSFLSGDYSRLHFVSQ